ncbi:MAG: lipoyl(octanoyl) transferase LipB [Melioribacteraceae bacterium]|nr:lipoyl(octanoyl) transferase LipB [Melioribacteraceae bacterium]
MGRLSISRLLQHIDLGIIGYKEAWDIQKELLKKRTLNEIPDTLLLLQHPHTYTLGKVADRKNLVGSDKYLKDNNIAVYDIDRGGDITYHGPGQVVGYPIIDLKEWKQDTHLYLRSLEEVILQVCKGYGLKAGRNEGLTGVWIEDRKICAIGIKVSRWVTMHGFAFNVNTDLSFFQGIIPCGITDKEVTSLQKETGMSIDLNQINEKIINKFVSIFGYDETVASELPFLNTAHFEEKGEKING